MATIVMIAAPSYGVYWWAAGRYIETTKQAYVHADVVTVSAHVPGYVLSVAVQDNQRVRAGDMLARLDDADYRIKVAQAQAALDSTLAALHSEEAMMAALDGRNAAQVDDATPVVRADPWVLVQRKAQHQAAIAHQRAQVDVARVALQQSERELARTAIYATSDGVIGGQSIRAGQRIETGQALMTVVPLDRLYVVANFKDSEIAAMRPGQSVDIDVDAYSGRTLRGHVMSIAAGFAASSAMANRLDNVRHDVPRIPVKIAFEAASCGILPLRPGMAVTARVHTRESTKPAAGV